MRGSSKPSADILRPGFLAMDEARFGLKTWHRRRWCPKGFRAPWTVEDRYEWLWLYAAVEPATGESLCLYLPRLDGACFEVFLEELGKAYPEEEIVLVLDGAPGHRSGQVSWPDGIEALPLPPYSPELIRNPVDHLRVTDEGWEKTAAPDRIISGPSAPVTRSAIDHSSSGFRINPVERLFEELRGELSNRVFETVEAMMGALAGALRPYWETPSALASLTGYGWWLEAHMRRVHPYRDARNDRRKRRP